MKTVIAETNVPELETAVALNVQEDAQFEAYRSGKREGWSMTENEMIDVVVETARGLRRGGVFIADDGRVVTLCGYFAKAMEGAVDAALKYEGSTTPSCDFVISVLHAHLHGHLTPKDVKSEVEQFESNYEIVIDAVRHFARCYSEEFDRIGKEERA